MSNSKINNITVIWKSKFENGKLKIENYSLYKLSYKIYIQIALLITQYYTWLFHKFSVPYIMNVLFNYKQRCMNMKKGTITKKIAIAAVLAMTMVSLGGCGDVKPADNSSAVSSEPAASEKESSAAADTSVSSEETDSSTDEAFDDSIYDYFHHEDFDYDGLSEIDGHIIDCGGNSGASDCFIVTDDYKVYHNL